MKRVFSLFLALVIVFGLLPLTALAGELNNGLQYEVYENQVEIIGYAGDATEIVVPAKIEGLPVTSIGSFRGCTSLTSIVIPESVTYISSDAFYECSNLASIHVDDNNLYYSSDDWGVLFNKEKTILIKAPVASVGSYTIPDGVTDIAHNAFEGCSSLTSISIPESVIYLDNMAFYECTSLTGIHVDDNNLYYSSDDWGILFNKEKTELIKAPAAIKGSYTIPSSVTFIAGRAFQSCSTLTNIDIPDGIAEIGWCTFNGCSNLTNIVIPKSVTDISYDAFSYCSNLTSIVIPKNVRYIAYDAFSYCSKLTGIHVDENNLHYSSDDRGVLFDKEKTKLIEAPGAITGSYTIPNSVTSISLYAFEGCSNLTSIDIPNSVTTIGDMAFAYCSRLIGIHVDNNNLHYSSDEQGVLFDKNKTTLIEAPKAIMGSYAIPGSVTSISWYAFRDCPKLTRIEFPDSVTVIGCDSFANCTSLSSVYFRGDAPIVYHDYADVSFETAFSGVTAKFYYPAGNPTWNTEVMDDSDGAFTWIPYNPDNPFTDVPAGAYYEAPVLWAVENGITSGVTADSFNPGGSCLRAQVVTFLWRAAKQPEPAISTSRFTDVKPTDFFFKPVLWAVEQNITSGVSATQFGSFSNCNRAAVVTFLWRSAGCPEPITTNNPFTDVNEGDFFYKPVLWAVENNITAGLTATTFGPTAECNRAQVVTFLYRAYN